MRVFANGDKTDGTMQKAMQGIAVPYLFDLPRTSRLYRFVDIRRGPHRLVANGPWWIESDYFDKLSTFAERHGYSLEFCARLFLAVLYEYSEVTGYVSAEVTKPLKAWKGQGKVQYSSGKDPRDSQRTIPMQSINMVYQLYIPGLHPGSPLLDEAFGNIQYHKLK
jgi:hypothetical protein